MKELVLIVECRMLPEIVIFHEAGKMLRSFSLQDGFTTFGRFPNSEICMDDPCVSRDHGAFSLRCGVLMIEDHDSSNGILMNGIKIKRKVLYGGDRLTIGPFEIHVKRGSVAPRNLGE